MEEYFRRVKILNFQKLQLKNEETFIVLPFSFSGMNVKGKLLSDPKFF